MLQVPQFQRKVCLELHKEEHGCFYFYKEVKNTDVICKTAVGKYFNLD